MRRAGIETSHCLTERPPHQCVSSCLNPQPDVFSRINLSNLRETACEEEKVISVEMNQRALEVTHNVLLPPAIKLRLSDRKPPVLTSPVQQ